MGYDMGDMMGGGILWGLLALLAAVVLVGVIAALVVYAVRWPAHDSGMQGHSPMPAGPDAATDILRRRYAAGEIDDEEFARRSELISRH